MKLSNNKARYTGYAIVLAGALLMFSPFYFMFVFATHTSSEIFSMPPPLWSRTSRRSAAAPVRRC